MKTESAPEKEEQLIALLSLAAAKASGGKVDDCPGEAQLAAFVQHQLEGEARQRMLAHLNRCPACLDHWLEVAACLSDAGQPAIEAQKTGSLARLRQYLKDWQRPWVLGVPATAVLALFCLVMLGPWLSTPDLHRQIDTSYAAVLAGNTSGFADTLRDLPLPWGSAPFAFSESPSPPPARAFGTGLWAGREALLGRGGIVESLPEVLKPPSAEAWPDSPWADYYAFGRWAVLAWTLVESDPAAVDWERQQGIVDRLLARFRARPAAETQARQATEALEAIRARLPALGDPADETARTQLGRQLVMIIYQLGPRS